MERLQRRPLLSFLPSAPIVDCVGDGLSGIVTQSDWAHRCGQGCGWLVNILYLKPSEISKHCSSLAGDKEHKDVPCHSDMWTDKQLWHASLSKFSQYYCANLPGWRRLSMNIVYTLCEWGAKSSGGSVRSICMPMIPLDTSPVKMQMRCRVVWQRILKE